MPSPSDCQGGTQSTNHALARILLDWERHADGDRSNGLVMPEHGAQAWNALIKLPSGARDEYMAEARAPGSPISSKPRHGNERQRATRAPDDTSEPYVQLIIDSRFIHGHIKADNKSGHLVMPRATPPAGLPA